MKGFELNLNGRIVRGAFPTNSSIIISNKEPWISVLFGSISDDGTLSYDWLREVMHSGDVLKIRFDDFDPDQLSEPKVTRFSARVCDKELLEDYYRLKAELEKE
jgi:hypothetical protein